MTTGALTTSYHYNGLGQRVSKTAPGSSAVSRRFVYDESGHLIAEYDASGTPIQETVYLGDLPIAVLSGTNGIHYVHADQINTPRAITDTQGAVVWRWESDAFGVGVPDQDPDADGVSLVYNSRMPGQYWDQETGLHYNYFRDYDPAIGRYIQPDPIGVLLDYGDSRLDMAVTLGLVTPPPEVRLLFNHLYGYAQQNPISHFDPDGLRWWKWIGDAGKWLWSKVKGTGKSAKEQPKKYVCPPERQKRCTEAFWRCISDPNVDEKLCILAQQTCITTPLPTLFPHGEWVK